MKRIRLDSAARAELLHEVRYYENARTGTGRKFREAVEQAFAWIKRSPGSGAPDEAGCRRIRIKGFRFSVVYREEATEIVVFAIRPDARQPGYWLPRTK